MSAPISCRLVTVCDACCPAPVSCLADCPASCPAPVSCLAVRPAVQLRAPGQLSGALSGLLSSPGPLSGLLFSPGQLPAVWCAVWLSDLLSSPGQLPAVSCLAVCPAVQPWSGCLAHWLSSWLSSLSGQQPRNTTLHYCL